MSRSRERGAPLLVDIRERYRRDIDPRADALAVPLFDLLAETVVLPREREILVVGDDDDQSRFAARVLTERGFEARWRAPRT